MIAEQIFPASVLDDDEALHGKGVQPDQRASPFSGEVALILDVPGLMKQVEGNVENQTGSTSLVQV